MIQGRSVGLITNPTGITRGFQSSVEVCASLPNARLCALFACEHGIQGQRQAGIRFDNEIDEKLGIPIYSLYGVHKKPTLAMLEGIDTLIFDIQDLGIRFFTYVSTLIYVLEACAEHDISLLVLDRPNPLGGLLCEGGILQPGYESMVGAWGMPIRTGMTIGELAFMVNANMAQHCKLDVIRMEGWRREMEFPQTGLPWLLPSPNIPSMETVRVYAGMCFLEGTNVSEGRGTTKPFEWFGAPWIDGDKLSKALNGVGLPGVHFHSVYATPMFAKHKGELCGGVRLFVTDPIQFQAVTTGLFVLHLINQLYSDFFEWLPPFREGGRPFIDLLAGGDLLRYEIASEKGLKCLVQRWEEDSEKWKELREPFLLYEGGYIQ
ncbi:DUF1343 domain-containing protein [Paenibacillus sp. SYP-B3998]|uniref:DUF1343 domain-containing protein n=2 Tax=Paenibacillus sp. SYP-B3998 TaxID=2678564 RepID=A0A6G4A1Z0_9BACL|nr:DUF1343 domain-containing protein [Paenibacillus sp. SYP-B3998]NEW07841.1 DUF1343 domain-containing protein [Paenibacillus sp. SYP-B3998]